MKTHVLSVMAVASIGAVASAEPILLRYDLTPGLEVVYRAEATQTSQNPMGAATIKTVDDNRIIVGEQVDGLWRVVMSNTTREYDVDGFDPMGGSTAMLDETVEIEAMYDLRGLGKDYRLISSHTDNFAMAEYTVEQLQTLPGMLGVYFPEQAVEVGDTWTAKADFSKLFEGNPEMMGATVDGGDFDITYELIDVAEGFATIEFDVSGDMELSIDAGMGPMSLPVMLDAQGMMVVEIASGFTERSESTILVELGGLAQGSFNEVKSTTVRVRD